MRKIALLLIALGCRSAFAWGPEGHRLVVRIAETMFSPAVRAQVQSILAPGEALSALASWADQIRRTHREMEPWHFVDVPLGSAGLDRQRDCPEADCIVAKIADFERIWRDPAANPAKRREALLFVVHFVGDLHEPLHCADNDDKGGNEVAVRFLGETTNLHALWDSGLLSHMPQEDVLFHTLSQVITPARIAEWSSGTVDQWCTESFHVAETTVYGLLPRGRPHARLILGESYRRTAEPVVELQIEKAGVRLAAILNESAP